MLSDVRLYKIRKHQILERDGTVFFTGVYYIFVLSHTIIFE